MKHRKAISAILSMVTACSVMQGVPAAYAAVSAVPEWVPTTSEDAWKFRNTHGSTHVEDDLICIVTRHWSRDAYQRLPLLGCGDFETLLDEWYCEDTQSDLTGVYPYYHVTVYKPLEAKTVVFYDYNAASDAKPDDNEQYIFAVEADLHPAETDWRASVPDCITEYRSFIQETGKECGLGDDGMTACNIDGRDSYLLMAASANGFVGSYMESKADLNGKSLTLKSVNCNYEYNGPEPTDQGSSFVRYCRIQEPGTVTATFTHTSAVTEHEPFSVTKTLTAAKNSAGMITLTAEQSAEEEWRKYVPDNSAEAYTFLRSKGLVSDSQMYNEFNIDNRGDYLIAATASYGGLSRAMAMVALEKNGTGLHMTTVDCKPVAEPGMVIDGECHISYVKITEPCTITAYIRNTEKDYQKTAVINVTKDADGKLCFAAEDEFSFLPKTFEEADAFFRENRAISEHEGYIVCCGETNLSTGYEILTDTAGSAGAEVMKEASFSWEPETLVDGGNKTYRFFVLKPQKKGLLKVTVRHAREWARNDGVILDTKYYTVADDLTLKKLSMTMGDLDGDGQTTTADLVILSRFLGGTGSLEEQQMFAADLLNDNRINAADLTVMKRQLAGSDTPLPQDAKP